uniref:Galectin n=1 Tax=Denticeps clupeoides TaxID=299321 RepID=A0AAY4C3Y8_9TELE
MTGCFVILYYSITLLNDGCLFFPVKELELKNVVLRAGDHLKIMGKILPGAKRFQIELGSDSNNMALHFNPRFETEENVIVCNSKRDGNWGEEQRESKNPFHPGSVVKVRVKVAGDFFEVELPNGEEIQFPNREGTDSISYVRVKGDFQLTCFKIY